MNCSVCENQATCKGMCQRHYRKQRKYGNPFGGRTWKWSEAKQGTLEYLQENSTLTDGPLDTPCWIWNRAVCPQTGYGNTWVGPKATTPHRLAYELTNGEISDSMLFVCHHCDVRACCNPGHLFVGTVQNNYDDMVAKGRQNPLKGNRWGTSKITRKQAQEILDRCRAGERCRDLAPQYGIHETTVSQIKTRRIWKELV